MIPIENSLIYVEPVYIQAEQAQMPELKQVIVAYGNKIAWDESFDGALRAVFLESAEAEEVTVAVEKKEIGLEELIESASSHFIRYQELTGQGKLVEAARELELLSEKLKELKSKSP